MNDNVRQALKLLNRYYAAECGLPTPRRQRVTPIREVACGKCGTPVSVQSWHKSTYALCPDCKAAHMAAAHARLQALIEARKGGHNERTT